MFKRFYPKHYIDSTYAIDFKAYYEKGFRGVLFDIDNTLVPHNAKADDRVIQLFTDLKGMGFGISLLSNNGESRVSLFSAAVGDIPYISRARKPSRKSYQRAMELMGTNADNTLFVGDQLFTDVYGANRTGLYSILVKPIHPSEEIQIVIKRRFEKIVLKGYLNKE